ncbi:MAG TPA: alpha/beta hydrolase [Kofleriaceae bacterium]
MSRARPAGVLQIAIPSLLIVAVGAGCMAPEERLDVSYDDRFGDATLMDLYLPDGDAPANPTVLFIHGGSWTGGSKKHFVAAGRRLARSGFVVASANYRLVPDGVFPNNIEDCICSLAYLRAHAADYRIDPDRILVMGYSAGAHLASLVGLASEHPELQPDCEAAAGAAVAPPAAVISASGPQDMRTFWDEVGDKSGVEGIFGGSPDELPRMYDLGSPRFHVRPGVPPFLLLEDALDFGGVEAMRAALVDDGNDARLLKIAGSLHILEQAADPGVYEGGVSSETPEAWIAIDDFLFRTIARTEAP